MSTVAEIETAILELPAREAVAINTWLDEHLMMIGASESMFLALDEEEGEQAANQWLGE